MARKVQLVRHPDYRLHATGEHPERPQRLAAIDAALAAADLGPMVSTVAPEPASMDAVLRVHTRSYVERLQGMVQRGGGFLDDETVVGPRSWDVALLAAGGAIRAVDAILDGEANAGFALVRPPGHHAWPNRGHGFCLLNNAAIAVRHALGTPTEPSKVTRAAIVDFDVHHGDGTYVVFEADPNVLFISLHEYPFWPFTGAADEIGIGDAAGTKINVPLPHRTGDDGYQRVFDEIVLPALARFQPELVFVSAGFDPHWADPLAFMDVSCAGFARLIDRLRSASPGGRLALTLEGGYNLDALGASVVAIVQELAGLPVNDPLGPSPSRGTADVGPAIEAVREAHRGHRLLR